MADWISALFPAAVLLALMLCPAGEAGSQAPLPAPEDVEPHPVVADIDFAEGPIFDRHGNLYFVNYLVDGTIGRRTPDGTVSVWIHTGGQANGLKIDAWDRVIAADYGRHGVTRIDPVTRKIEVLSDSYEGEPYRGPNDVCLDLKGNIYFTDPTGSSAEKPIGAIYRIGMSPAGEVQQVTRIAKELAFPNGLAVSPDQKRFYLAESGHSRILGWDLRDDGTLENRQTVIQFPNSGVDGIMFDEAGRLWIARWDNQTVDVVDVEKGELLQSYPAGGDWVSNLCWWDKSVYLTVAKRHSIHRLDVGVRGADIIPPRPPRDDG